MHEESAMPTLIKSDRLRDIDLSKVEMPDVDLSKIELPKVDLKNLEVPKVDVGKAIADAATAVGLAKHRRSRLPYVIVGGVVVAIAGWALMNSQLIRERLSRARDQVVERINTMRNEDDFDDAVAFTAAPTAPLDQPTVDSVTDSTGADYPEGLGSAADTLATNGRKVGASTR